MIFQKKMEVDNWKVYRKSHRKTRCRFNLLHTGGDLAFVHLVWHSEGLGKQSIRQCPFCSLLLSNLLMEVSVKSILTDE